MGLNALGNYTGLNCGMGLNNSYSNFNTPSFGMNNTSLMGGNMFPSTTLNGLGSSTDYTNDIMFPPELSMNYNQPVSQNQPAYNQQTQVQNQNSAQVQNQQSENGYAQQQSVYNQDQSAQNAMEAEKLEQIQQLQQSNPNIKLTPNGNLYVQTNFGKKTGVLIGVISPIAKNLANALSSGKFSKAALNLKSLAIKVPVFAVVGWGIGALADAFFNKSKATVADRQALAYEQAQQPQQQSGFAYQA